MAHAEYLTYLAIFLDDALAIEESEAVTTLNLVVEQMIKLLVGHSLAGILYFYLNVVGLYPRLHIYTPAVIGKLTGIVGQSV